jgi:ankyrin repeat protein
VGVVDPCALIKVCSRSGSGDVGEARDLIARGVNINKQDKYQSTALIYAAEMNRIEIVKELVRAGVTLDVQNADGKTALIFAVVRNRIEVVKELVRAGAALDVQNNDGQTALMNAAVLNRIEMVKELMPAGAALDVQNKNGMTGLMYAVFHNRIEVVKELVRAGAALNVQNKQGTTALQWAQEKGLTEIVAILEKAARERRNAAGEGKARDGNAKGDTCSNDEGGAGADQLFHEHDAVLGCAHCGEPATNHCSKCKTTLYCSTEHQLEHWNAGHKEACKVLCRDAARAAKRARRGGAGKGDSKSFPAYNKEALIKLCRREGSGDVGEARDLIARGITINEQDEYQFTALMFAAHMNRIEIVKELVRVGATLDVQNDDDTTALMIAAAHDRIEVVKELVRAGAALEVQDTEGLTALHIAQIL